MGLRDIAGVRPGYWRPMTLLLGAVITCTAASVSAIPASAQEVVAGDVERTETPIASTLDDYLTRLEIYGFSGAVLVAAADSVILERGYGLAHDASGREVEADMPFLIGSLSKQFTAAAILALEADGRITTDDPLRRFFPGAPDAVASTTLHALLTHTAGLPYLPDEFMEMKPRGEVIAEMLRLPIDPDRAGSYFYSSPGYTLLAGVVEAASGLSYEDYLRSRLFESAGMSSSGFIGDAAWEAAPALHSYSGAVDEGPLHNFPALPKALGAGSVVSTVGDLYRWATALRSDAVIPAAARDKLFARHVSVQGPTSHGYGWNIATTSRGSTLVVHAGDLGGYNSELRWYPDEDVVIVLLSNRRVNGQGWRVPVMNNLSLILAGETHSAPPQVTRAPSARLEPLAGEYALANGGRFHVTADDGVLRIGAEGQAAAAALHGMTASLEGAANALNERARALVDMLEAGKLDGISTYLHPSLPADDARQGIEASLSDAREEQGPLVGFDVLGTVANSPVTATTAIRVRHTAGEWLLHLAWVGGAILGLDTATALAHPATFAASQDGDFSAFDAFTGRTVTASFEMGPSGRGEWLWLGDTAGERVGAAGGS